MECGTCKYHRNIDGEWTCDNEDSEYYGLEMEYDFSDCVDYEERE